MNSRELIQGELLLTNEAGMLSVRRNKATGWSPEELWFDSRQGYANFLFSKAFRLVLVFTIQWNVCRYVPVGKAAWA